jgi:hypothetical protein
MRAIGLLSGRGRSNGSGDGPHTLEALHVVDFLRNLPALWEAAPNTRRALAESLFESVDVLELDTMHVEPTPAAVRRGLADAFVLMSWSWSGRECRGDRM